MLSECALVAALINRAHASINILNITGTAFEVEVRGVRWSVVVAAVFWRIATAGVIVGRVGYGEPGWVGLSERRGRSGALVTI